MTALGLVLCISTGATDSVQAGHHSRVHAAKHHHSTVRRVCYVTRYHTRTHTARRVCHSVGGYSRLTARKVLWGPAGMPPAPKDFGPHFDFPAHSHRLRPWIESTSSMRSCSGTFRCRHIEPRRGGPHAVKCGSSPPSKCSAASTGP